MDPARPRDWRGYDYEARLAALLEERAQQIDLRPDLQAALSLRVPMIDPPRTDLVVVDHGRRRWRLVAAAAVALLVGTVATVVALDGSDESIKPASRSLEGPIRESQIVVGFDPHPTVESVEAAGVWLRADHRVVRLEFVGRAGALTEFEQIFADQPDLVDAIEEGNLPVSYRVTLHTGMDDDPFELVDALFSALPVDGLSASAEGRSARLPITALPPDVDPNQVWTGPVGGIGMQELSISLWSSPSHLCGHVVDGLANPFGSPPQSATTVHLFCGTGELVISGPFDGGDHQFRALVGRLPACVVDVRPTGSAMTEGRDSAVATGGGTVEALLEGDPGRLRVTLESGDSVDLELPQGEGSLDWPAAICE